MRAKGVRSGRIRNLSAAEVPIAGGQACPAEVDGRVPHQLPFDAHLAMDYDIGSGPNGGGPDSLPYKQEVACSSQRPPTGHVGAKVPRSGDAGL
jgi:hypothetical protein